MPPGYEHIVGPSANTDAKGTTSVGQPGVKNRLGPPASTVINLRPQDRSNTSVKLGSTLSSIPSITRTISNPHTVASSQFQHQVPLPSGSIPAAYEIQSIGSTHVPNANLPPQQTAPVIYHGAPPMQYPPTQTAPYPYPTQVQSTYPQPPVPTRIAPQPPPMEQGPPYPVNDPVVPSQQVGTGFNVYLD